MNNDNVNEKKSIAIIEDMINTAKQEDSGGAWYFFVLWGCIVMLFFLFTFLAIQTNANWQPWTYSLFVIGGILSFFRKNKDDKEEKVKSWFDDLYMYVWMGIGISLGLLWAFLPLVGLSNLIPLSLMLYALASFITGGVTKFYPSLVGAIICFICVAVAFNVSFAYQNIICAFAVLCVHVIPGLVMRKKRNLKNYVQ